MRLNRSARVIGLASIFITAALVAGCPTARQAPPSASADLRTESELPAAPEETGRELPPTDPPRVRIDTAVGSFTLEIEAERAPLTTDNFLRYVSDGFYSDGEFFRTVTATNQPNDTVRIAVIQGGANPAREGEAYEPIPLERTCNTGLRHLDGAVSMARSEPDSATHSFFICIGDQPALDFGGRRNPDGQGFGAFGRVVEGMDVVREIHAMPADGQSLDPPVHIQSAVRVR